ncbi:MAG: YfiR family protein [Candidatus Aminicenantales bacterium]
MKSRAAGVILILSCLISAGTDLSAAQNVVLDAPLQYEILLKVLTFDRNLEARLGRELIIGIVFQKGNRDSSLMQQDILKAAIDSRISPFAGRPVRVVLIDLDRSADLDQNLGGDKVDVLYIAPLRAVSLDGIIAWSRDRKILTVTGMIDYVEKGIAVGIDLNDDSPEILINLAAAKASGADFGSNLLKLSRIIF